MILDLPVIEIPNPCSHPFCMREKFESRTKGAAIRRIGHARARRNNAVAPRNAPVTPDVSFALRRCADDADRSIALPTYRGPITRMTDLPSHDASFPNCDR